MDSKKRGLEQSEDSNKARTRTKRGLEQSRTLLLGRPTTHTERIIDRIEPITGME